MASPLDFPVLNLRDDSKKIQVDSVLQPLQLSESTVQRMQQVFIDEIQKGLSAEPSSLLMENTFVPELMNGTEEGEYLALDLGGTNFRVIMVKLHQGKCVNESINYYTVPEDIRLGEGERLFDFLADCIVDFSQKRNLKDRTYNLGFTFSFPMTQRALDIGILVSWTKSFNCSGVVGEDAVKMLNAALAKRKEVDVCVSAVLNDTTGTLLQGSFIDSRCAIGMILGTGSNACYLESSKAVKKWKGEHVEKEVIIDIEWGAFGDNGVLSFLKTQWDEAVDEKSLLRNSYTFEKYFAGKYYGDLVREILLTLAQKGHFGGGCEPLTKTLGTHGSLTTADASKFDEEYISGGSSQTKDILQNLGSSPSQDDIKIAQFVSALVAYRGVTMVSALTSLLLQRMSRPHTTIAIDGSLYRHHPRFEKLMTHLLQKFAPGLKFSLLEVQDGSGKGAALVASIAQRLKN